MLRTVWTTIILYCLCSNSSILIISYLFAGCCLHGSVKLCTPNMMRMPPCLPRCQSRIVNVEFQQRWSNQGIRKQLQELTTSALGSGVWPCVLGVRSRVTHATSFNGLTDLRSLILEFVYFLIMRMKLSHTMSSSDGCLLHQILLWWRRKRRRRLQASLLGTGHCATVESIAIYKDPTLNYLLSSHRSSVTN